MVEAAIVVVSLAMAYFAATLSRAPLFSIGGGPARSAAVAVSAPLALVPAST